MLRVLALVAVAMAAMTHGAPRGSTGFTVEIYGNSVMRGTPVCTSVQPNGFNLSLGMVCPDAAVLGPSGVLSARVTGTLTPDTEGWHRFAGQVDKLTWVRLWVDVSPCCSEPIPSASLRSKPWQRALPMSRSAPRLH